MSIGTRRFSMVDLGDNLRLSADLPPLRTRTSEEESQLRDLRFPQVCYEACGLAGMGDRATDANCVRLGLDQTALSDALAGTMACTLVSGAQTEADSTKGWLAAATARSFQKFQTFTMQRGSRLEPTTRGSFAPQADFGLSEAEWRIARFGTQLVIDEMDFLDDTLGLFLGALRELGRASERLKKDLVFATLLSNPTLDSDGLAAFCTDHGNLASGGTSALDAGSLATAMTTIGNQTYPDRDGNPVHPNFSAKFLIVPCELESTARALVRTMALDDGKDLIVRAESRMGGGGFIDPASGAKVAGTATNWMLAASAADAPSIVAASMEGYANPRVVRQPNREMGAWNERWLVNSDVAAKIISGKGLYWSVGA